MNSPDDLLKFAVELATAAGEVLAEGAKRRRDYIDTKSSAVDVVTEIDHASEQLIVSMIRAQRPDDGILGEEGTSVESRSGIEWVLDPLDGTVNFVYSIPAFAVSVGVVQHGDPVAGAVFNPALGEMYTAAKGSGAFCNNVSIRCNEVTDLSVSLVGTGFNYDAGIRADQSHVLTRVLPRARDIRRSGSAALDMCNLARGRLDAYYELGVNPWDVAAGSVIATEAGAIVSPYGGDVKSRVYFAACSQPVFDELQRLVL